MLGWAGLRYWKPQQAVRDWREGQEGKRELLHGLPQHSIRGVLRAMKDVQFLMPKHSSMRPSYVSWVSSGVIMSAPRSMMMSESIGHWEAWLLIGPSEVGGDRCRRLANR